MTIDELSTQLNEEIALTASDWADLAAEDKRLGEEISKLTARRESLRNGLGKHIDESREGITVEGIGTLDWRPYRRGWLWDVRALYEQHRTEFDILFESRGLTVNDKVAEALVAAGQLVIPKDVRHEETTRALRWQK